jgi:hypothetical protein
MSNRFLVPKRWTRISLTPTDKLATMMYKHFISLWELPGNIEVVAVDLLDHAITKQLSTFCFWQIFLCLVIDNLV